jgi:hypothetical protein
MVLNAQIFPGRNGSSEVRVGQNHLYTVYKYGIFGREITRYTVFIYNSGQPYLRLCVKKPVLLENEFHMN